MKPQLFIEPKLPNDHELQRLTDYVGGFMTPSEVAAFDEQLATDEEFYHRMAPMLKVWYTRTPAPSIMQAGVRIRERRAKERMRASGSRFSRGIALGSLLAAASAGFVMVQGPALLQFAPRGHVGDGAAVAKAPDKHGATTTTLAEHPAGVKDSTTAKQPTRFAQSSRSGKVIRERQRVTAAAPTIDTVAGRVIAEWPLAPMPGTSVSTSSVPAGIILPTPPQVPIAAGNLVTEVTTAPGDGPQMIQGPGPVATTGESLWRRILRKLFHR